MSSDYDLTQNDIREGIRLCHRNVNRLLDDAEVILSKSDRYISSGLYTYAVEELGKLLLLQKELKKTPSTSGIISVDPSIFGKGKGKHPTMKFDEFLNETSIPIECKKLRYVKGGVSTGTSFIALFGEASTDFLLRQNIFYVDWDKGWIKHQDVEISDLKQAITKLRTWISTNITIP